MKKNEESGFILMIIVIVTVVVFVVGFAAYRIINANSDGDGETGGENVGLIQELYDATELHIS